MVLNKGGMIMVKKELIKELLKSTHRKEINEMIEYLEEEGYFESPASLKHHGNYSGGLADHSYNLLTLFSNMVDKYCYTEIKRESIIICSLLHDLCKVGSYNKDGTYSRNHPEGHSTLSIQRIEMFIKLTDQERNIIMFHMGYYGSREFSDQGEYNITELSKSNNYDSITKLFYWCDDICSTYIDKKKE